MLRRLIKFFLHLALFSVLVVLTTTFFPFIGGKYYFFRIAVELALIFFALWWAFEAKPGEAKQLCQSVARKPLFLAVSLFVLMHLLASIFAHDPHAAFWSNYERGEGGFQMLHYYAFFVLATFFFREWRDWQLAFRLSVGVGILMILYGIGAAMHIDNFVGTYQSFTPEDSLWERLSGPRFQGSLGNPAYVAPYLFFGMFYALYLWLRSPWRTPWLNRAAFGSVIIFFLLFFFLSQTRGAFLGMIAAILAFLIYLVVTSSKLRFWGISAFVACIAIGGMLMIFKDSEFVKAIPGSRVFDLSFSEDTVQTRLWTWGSAWEGFKDRPILGWGPENFSTVFDKYFDTRHYVAGKNTETWFDRAHSVFFDYLAETGILGLLSYLAIFAVFVFEFIKRFARAHHPTPSFAQSVQSALIFSVPAGYLVQGLALFDVLPIYLNLFLFLGFSTYLFYFSKS